MMWLYRALLYLYPTSFRHEYATEMVAVFERRQRDAASGLTRSVVALAAIADVFVNAARVHVDILRQDLRYTARALGRAKGYAVTATLITALGVGATTAAFSITDQVLFKPFGFADADRLVKLWQSQEQVSRFELSPLNYRDWKERSGSFESMAAFSNLAVNLVGGREPQRLDNTLVTAELFPMLGASPAFGRVFTADDDRDGAPSTAILSYALWQSEFAADASVVGRVIRLDDQPFTVIGVMPASFTFPTRETQIWTPARFDDGAYADRTNTYLQAIAKLKAGVTLDQARAEMTAISAQLERDYPKDNAKIRATVISLRGELSSQTRLLVSALFGAALCLLLIACTNLASLLLTRVVGRRGELAVRTALGAGRERLVRQLLTESVLISMVGGAAGVLIAVTALPLLARLVPLGLPIGQPTVMDLRVLAFAALITCGTGIGFGVVPAFRLTRQPEATALREGTRAPVSAHSQRLRRLLVVAQVTASVALLIAAGLLIRALWRVQAVDPGFRTADVLAVQTPLHWPKYARTAKRVDLYDRILSSVRGLPGVTSAAYISFIPINMGGGIWSVNIHGKSAVPAEARSAHAVSLRFVSPGFFETLGIPIKTGRDVSHADSSTSPFVAVVSESFARRFWPGEDPIGRTFFVSFFDRTVVGVASDIRVRGLERDSEPQVYLPYSQIRDGWMPFYAPKELVVRSTGNPLAMAPSIRRIVHDADPELPVSRVRTLADVVDTATAPRATQVRVLEAFAALSLLLAGLGIHGLLAYAVSQRRAEIGLRIALGARSSDILHMVLREGLVLATIGAALGVIVAYIAGRNMQAILAGVGPADPATFLTAALLALAMTAAGSLLPALRALRVDAITVMRTQ
jgi:putative ABC transport system permease protein